MFLFHFTDEETEAQWGEGVLVYMLCQQCPFDSQHWVSKLLTFCPGFFAVGPRCLWAAMRTTSSLTGQDLVLVIQVRLHLSSIWPFIVCLHGGDKGSENSGEQMMSTCICFLAELTTGNKAPWGHSVQASERFHWPHPYLQPGAQSSLCTASLQLDLVINFCSGKNKDHGIK